MSEQDQEMKEVHVDKLTIHADQIFLEGSVMQRRNPFFFGRGRSEEVFEKESGENETVRRRRNPFLRDDVFRPTRVEETEPREENHQDDQAEMNESSHENHDESVQVERRRPFWLR